MPRLTGYGTLYPSYYGDCLCQLPEWQKFPFGFNVINCCKKEIYKKYALAHILP
jgi:hypothetical protein